MEYRIPVPNQDSLRTLRDPDPNRSGIRIVHAVVRVSDLPANMPHHPDPRVPKPGRVATRIANSLRENDGRFHLLNRGITISARRVTFNNQDLVLTLDLPDEQPYGILDGLHTYKEITTAKEVQQRRQDTDTEFALDRQHVHIEVLEGVESHLADIAEARNYSVSLKAETLAGYRKKFDWFLDALPKDYRSSIRISENDTQPVSIVDLIQVMCAVNPVLFPQGKPALEAYKNAGKCLDYFIDKDDAYGFHKLESIATDVVRLYDYIRYHWKQKYNAEDTEGRRGKLGRRKEVTQRKRGRGAMTTYYFLAGMPGLPKQGPVKGADVPIEKGFAIPLISSFRALLEEKTDGQIHWYTDPFEFFNEHGTTLVRNIMDASDNVGNNPHTVGRDPQVYNALYTEVRRWYLEGVVASQQTQIIHA